MARDAATAAGRIGWAWSRAGGLVGRRTPACEQPPERGHDVGPGRGGPAGEALLEAAVVPVAEVPVGGDRRRVVGADVEDHLVARTEELRGHRAGDGLGVSAPAVVDVGQHVAHDRETGLPTDDVGPGRGDEPAVDADAVVDALRDGGRRQPCREPQLVEAVELVCVHGQEALDLGSRRLEGGAVDPHPDHLGPGFQPVVLGDRRHRLRLGGDIRRPRPDHVTQDGRDPVELAHHEHRLGSHAAVLEGDRDQLVTGRGDAPPGPAELALREVTDRVGGEQPVPLKELSQPHPIRGAASEHACPGADRRGGHQGPGFRGGLRRAARSTGAGVGAGVVAAAARWASNAA